MKSIPYYVRVFAGLLAAGVLLVIAFYVLDGLDVSGIGDTADIGGGLMLLLGYALAACGFFGLIISWLTQKARGRK